MNTNTNHGQLVAVESIKREEFVRKISKCGECGGTGEVFIGCCGECGGDGFKVQARTYKRGEYDKTTKRYSLVDCDDFCREVFVKKGTKLLIGFTY